MTAKPQFGHKNPRFSIPSRVSEGALRRHRAQPYYVVASRLGAGRWNDRFDMGLVALPDGAVGADGRGRTRIGQMGILR